MPREQDSIDVATRLVKHRLARGATQRQLADAAGVDVATVARIEQGRNRPSVSTLRRLAYALECSIDDLA